MKKQILSFAFLVASMSMSAGVVYVAPAGAGDGTSWDSPLGNIQDAIKQAQLDETGQTDVWLKGGTYLLESAITLHDSVNLYGGFAGTETTIDERTKNSNNPWDFTNLTIIDAQNKDIPCAKANKSGGYVQPLIVDGVVFQNGRALAANSDNGGGIRLNLNATLQNSIVRNCYSDNAGGGVQMYPGGNMHGCLLENNRQETGSNGGGAVNLNTSTSGVEAYITNCVFRGNSTNKRGGAINCQGGTDYHIDACTFYNNYSVDDNGALADGGAIYDNGSQKSHITNCVVFNNSGKQNIYLKANEFFNNTLVKNVGNLWIAAGASTGMVCNNIIWNCYTAADEATPTSLAGNAISGLTVLNNYTYNPVPETKNWVLSLDPDVANSNVQFVSNTTNGDFTPAEGADYGSKSLVGPHFRKLSSFSGAVLTDDAEIKAALLAQLDSVDLHISAASALLNAGTELENVSSDRDGNNRPQGGKTDVGAYEVNYFTVFIPTVSEEVGLIYDETGNPAPAEVTCMEGGTLVLMIMTAEGTLPYKVETILSTDGGMTFTGERKDVTSLINPETFMINLKVEATMQLEVTWTAPIADYTVTLAVAAGCEDMGTVEGAGTYAAGTEITIKAIAKAGYRFVKWSDENTEAERKIVVNEDLSLTATFEQGEGLADAVANTLAIIAEKNGVRVSGLQQGSTVEVFDINGRQVFTAVAESETLYINLQQGMYIIRQGANRGKAIVK